MMSAESFTSILQTNALATARSVSATTVTELTAVTAYGLNTNPLDEVKAAFAKVDMSKYKEVVFCGYGEPMERVNEVIAVGEFVKANYGDVTVRLNTNGLGDKIHGVPTAKLLQGAVDIVSISLNSYCKEKYNEVTRPKWDDAFDAMLSFAADCKSYLPQVVFTVVDVIPPEDISRAKALAMSIGIPLRVREYEN